MGNEIDTTGSFRCKQCGCPIWTNLRHVCMGSVYGATPSESADLTRLRAELEEANECRGAHKARADAAEQERAKLQAKLRHYEETVCLDGGIRRMHEDGALTLPVNTVKLGELFAKLAAAEAARDEAKALAETTAVYWAKEVECVKHWHEETRKAHDRKAKDVDQMFDRVKAAEAERDEAQRQAQEWRSSGNELANLAHEAQRDRDAHKARADAACELLRKIRAYEKVGNWNSCTDCDHTKRCSPEAGCYDVETNGLCKISQWIDAFLASPGASGGEQEAASNDISSRPDMGFEVRVTGSTKTVKCGDGAKEAREAGDVE